MKTFGFYIATVDKDTMNPNQPSQSLCYRFIDDDVDAEIAFHLDERAL